MQPSPNDRISHCPMTSKMTRGKCEGHKQKYTSCAACTILPDVLKPFTVPIENTIQPPKVEKKVASKLNVLLASNKPAGLFIPFDKEAMERLSEQEISVTDIQKLVIHFIDGELQWRNG